MLQGPAQPDLRKCVRERESGVMKETTTLLHLDKTLYLV